MSTNCVSCVTRERTGLDLLCDECRIAARDQAVAQVGEMIQDELTKFELLKRVLEKYEPKKTSEITDVDDIARLMAACCALAGLLRALEIGLVKIVVAKAED